MFDASAKHFTGLFIHDAIVHGTHRSIDEPAQRLVRSRPLQPERQQPREQSQQQCEHGLDRGGGPAAHPYAATTAAAGNGAQR